VSASEGRSVTLIADETTTYGELVGTSTGTPAMRFVLGESPVVDGSVEVYVQDGDLFSKWTQVEHIIDYSTNDLVYSLFIDDNNLVYINFGDGVSGVIPTNYSEIRALYTVGGGSIGNIESAVIDTIEFIPGLSEGETTAVQGAVTVTNETAALGGSDPETNDQIRASAPAALRSGNRAVTLKDFSDLALSVSGVGKANATAAVWTSVTLYIAPSRSATDIDIAPGLDDSGDPTAEFERIQTSVEEFLTNKVLIGTTVTVQPPTYTDLICTLAYTKTDQYTTAEVEENIKIAILTGFGYVNATFAETIYPRDVEFMVLQAPGVKTVNVTALHLAAGSGANTMVGTAGQIWRFQEANLNIAAI
jgi:predicted phage baseplate assembly protein